MKCAIRKVGLQVTAFMPDYLYIRILSFCFILSFPFGRLTGQTTPAIVHDSLNYIPYNDFFERLKTRDSVNIFYKPEWFENKKINSSFADLKLEEALLRVTRLCNLSYIVIDKNSFVFVPFQAAFYQSTASKYSDVLQVGNPDEYGKFTKATLKGKILDGVTGEPLAGATVNVEKLKIATTTDVNGNFSLTLPAGEHTVKLTYIGYEESTRKINLVSDGEASFGIIEKSVKLREVVVTAERAEFNVTGTQMSLVSLNVKNIRELPVSLGEKDIVRSMSLLPGIQTAGEFGAGFYVRGGSSDQNLILIEDVPLFNSSHLFGLTSTVNSDNVSGVTLLKAGIPARYGERASSIMNIRLGTDQSEKFRLTGGIGLLFSRLSFQIPVFNKKASLLIGGRSSYSDWLLHKIPDVDLMNSTVGFYDVNVLYTHRLNPDNKIILFGYYSDDKFAFSKNTNYAYNNIMASARWTHQFGRRLSSSTLAGLSLFDYGVSDLDTLHLPDAYKLRLNTQYYNMKSNFAWLPDDRHSVDFGVNAVLYKLRPGEQLPYGSESLVKPFSVQSEKGLEMAAYISDNFDILPRLSTEIGLRYVQYLSLGPSAVLTYLPGFPRSAKTISDTLHYGNNEISHSYPAIEPRISFRYILDDASSVKWSYNRINQFINLISNNSVISPADTWTLCNTNLRPLTSDQYAIGYFRNFVNNTYEISVEVYYKALKNVIEYKNGAQVFLNTHVETDLLSAGGYGYGIELYARKTSGPLTGWISYTYSRSMLRTAGLSDEEQINNNHYYPSNFDKPHNLVISANYHVSRRWRFSGTFVFNTGRPVTLPELKYTFQGNQLIWFSERNKYRLPDYHRLDIAISFDENLRLKKMWKGSWTLSVINVYGRNNTYSEYYAREDSRIYKSTGRTSFYKLYIIGTPLPTLTYNFVF